MNRAETEREGEGKKKQATKWRGEGRSGGGRAARSIQGGREGLRCGIASSARIARGGGGIRGGRRRRLRCAFPFLLVVEKSWQRLAGPLARSGRGHVKTRWVDGFRLWGPLSHLDCYVASPTDPLFSKCFKFHTVNSIK